MTAMQRYLHDMTHHLGDAWNRFWFAPRSAAWLGKLRVAVGLWTLVWQLSFTPDLIRWFGPNGWFDASLYRTWVLDPPPQLFSGRLSYLFNPTPSVLWALHWLGAAILVAFTLGVWTRVTKLLAVVVTLAYVHRAPFVCAGPEAVIVMLLLYLCLAPSGQFASLDRVSGRARADDGPTWHATLAQRLMQVHLTFIYATMVATKLLGQVWWNGDAVWWPLVQPSSSLIGVNWLHQSPVLMNVWTYAILLSEVAMVTLVWHRWLRPLVLVGSALSWLSVGLATGSLALPITMLVANLAFVSAEGDDDANRTPSGAN